MLECDTVIYM